MRKINHVLKIPVLLLLIGISTSIYAEEKSNKVQEPSYKGSIIVGQAERSDFPDMAKISLQEAMQTALTRVPGKVLKIELENENDYLVYGVEIVSGDKSITDVKIDAGTGSVLKLDQHSADHREGKKHKNRERENEEEED
ncbi:MAG TPA: PepSY domain-containing protein [Candidatus Limnocylindrales bacterium]|nr:PepSY domain-containing protein [Candidatus Limnocylindrales bacterium]